MTDNTLKELYRGSKEISIIVFRNCSFTRKDLEAELLRRLEEGEKAIALAEDIRCILIGGGSITIADKINLIGCALKRYQPKETIDLHGKKV